MCEPHSAGLASAITTALRGSILLGALILGVIASAAIWTIPLIYSDKWLPALPIVWSLVPHVLADIGMSQMTAMAQGQGKPGKALWFYIVWSVATWVVCGMTLFFGEHALDWIGWGQSLGTVGAAVFALRWVDKQAAAPVGQALIRPLLVVTGGALAAYFVNQALTTGSFLRALCGVVTFLAVTALLGFIIDRESLIRDLRGAINSFRNRKKKKTPS